MAAGGSLRVARAGGGSVHRPSVGGGRGGRRCCSGRLVDQQLRRSLPMVGGSRRGKPLHLVPGARPPHRRVERRSPVAAAGDCGAHRGRHPAVRPPGPFRRVVGPTLDPARPDPGAPGVVAHPPASLYLAAGRSLPQDALGPSPLRLDLGRRPGAAYPGHVLGLAGPRAGRRGDGGSAHLLPPARCSPCSV